MAPSSHITSVLSTRQILLAMLSWLELQTPIVHLVHVAGCLDPSPKEVLELGNGLEWVGRCLVLLDVMQHFGYLLALRKINVFCRCVVEDAVVEES